MKISILSVGRLKSGPEQTLFNRYCDLFNAQARALKIAPVGLIELAESRADTAPARKKEEADLLLAKLAPGARLIALDEHGQQLTSEQFSAMIERLRLEAMDAAFALGGADGHGEKVLTAAHFVLALSPMTLTHGLARIVLAEQLYRALTIISGHPYHRL